MEFTKEKYIGIILALLGIFGVIEIIIWEEIRNSSYGFYSISGIVISIILLVLGIIIFFMKKKKRKWEEELL